MQRISAYFFGGSGDPLDKAAHSIFKSHHGKFIGSGTMLVGPAIGERDIEYEIADDRVSETKSALKKAGLRLERTT